jgi:hypothetical protein
VEPKESQNTNREVRKYIQKLFPLLVSFLCALLLQTFMPWYSRFRERCRKWNRNIHEIHRICVTFSGGITGTDGNVNVPYLFPGHVQFVCNFVFLDLMLLRWRTGGVQLLPAISPAPTGMSSRSVLPQAISNSSVNFSVDIGRSGNIFESRFHSQYCGSHLSAVYFFQRLCPGTVGSESGAGSATETFTEFTGMWMSCSGGITGTDGNLHLPGNCHGIALLLPKIFV